MAPCPGWLLNGLMVVAFIFLSLALVAYVEFAGWTGSLSLRCLAEMCSNLIKRRQGAENMQLGMGDFHQQKSLPLCIPTGQRQGKISTR
jgi:hypothetical protein